jgi:hypothetical protein
MTDPSAIAAKIIREFEALPEWKTAPAVQQFLDRNAEQVAPRVKREVGNKLRTGLKNP